MEENEKPTAAANPRRFLRKGLIDVVIAITALFVSAVSLWIGVRNENASESLVAASTWPFLQVQISNADTNARLDLQFMVVNTGVGPAKIESFEVFYKGKPYRSAKALLTACCGYKEVLATSPDAKNHTPLLVGTVQGIVMRPGDTETFIHYPMNADNRDVWTKLDNARGQMTYRICYCSVLNECYRNALHSELYIPGQLHPEEVSTCPVPALSYAK